MNMVKHYMDCCQEIGANTAMSSSHLRWRHPEHELTLKETKESTWHGHPRSGLLLGAHYETADTYSIRRPMPEQPESPSTTETTSTETVQPTLEPTPTAGTTGAAGPTAVGARGTDNTGAVAPTARMNTSPERNIPMASSSTKGTIAKQGPTAGTMSRQSPTAGTIAKQSSTAGAMTMQGSSAGARSMTMPSTTRTTVMRPLVVEGRR